MVNACLLSTIIFTPARSKLYNHAVVRGDKVDQFIETITNFSGTDKGPAYVTTLKLSNHHGYYDEDYEDWKLIAASFWSRLANLTEIDINNAPDLIEALLLTDEKMLNALEEPYEGLRYFTLPHVRKIKLRSEGEQFLGFDPAVWIPLGRHRNLTELEIIVRGFEEYENDRFEECLIPLDLASLSISAEFTKHVQDFIKFIGPTNKVLLCDASIGTNWKPIIEAIPDTITDLTLLHDMYDFDIETPCEVDDRGYRYLDFDLGPLLPRFSRLQHLNLSPGLFKSSRQFFLSLPMSLIHLQLIGPCDFKLNHLIPLIQRSNSNLLLLGLRVPHRLNKKFGGMDPCKIPRFPKPDLPDYKRSCKCFGQHLEVCDGIRSELRPMLLHHMKHFDPDQLQSFIGLAEGKGIEVYGYEVDYMIQEREREKIDKEERLEKRKLNSRKGKKGKK